jgi:DNA-binding response OmpR family regulator
MDDLLHGRTVLVIDDDPGLLTLVERLLARAGARAVLAEDGHSGLRLFHQHRPDLVVLEIMMSDLNGHEVCWRLRELSDMPVLMLTALNDPRQVAGRLEEGADDYVTKPFSNEVLLARLRALLRRPRARSQTTRAWPTMMATWRSTSTVAACGSGARRSS